MSRSTEDLIAALAADLKPVRRLKPPMARAGLWLLATAAVAGAAVLLLSDLQGFMARAADPRLRIELGATLATGVLAVIAAFHLALPDRSRAWALLPLPTLLLWLGASGVGCYRAWLEVGPMGTEPGRSWDCLLFLLAASLPMGAVLLWGLAKAKPLEPVSTAALGGLGVAALSAFLLQFFHPFDITALDFGVHLATVALIVAVAGREGGRVIA
jgi:hypothetical protein